MSTVPYAKPWLSYQDQVLLLKSRGLVIGDTASASQFLQHLNYYRFSGYCIAFEVSRHQFVAGTTFEQVVHAYQFDLTLRDLITEALEVVEVDLRSCIAYVFTKAHGAFGHTDPANFYRKASHADWLDRVRVEADRSSELFVHHCKRTYSQYPDLPGWIVTETISFGALSKMVSAMDKRDQKAIAHRYGIQPLILESWMHHLVYIRNLCAHHSRLWDRIWNIKPELPAGKYWQKPNLDGNIHLFATLLVLRTIMRYIPSSSAFASEWRNRMESHMKSPPAAAGALGIMGLPDKWNEHALWV